MVTEYPDGRTTVRPLSEDEKRRKAKKHLAALRSLGHHSDALDAEFARLARSLSNSSVESMEQQPRPKRRDRAPSSRDQPPRRITASPEPMTATAIPEENEEADEYFAPAADHRTGISLSRTDRIEPDSDEEAGDAADAQPEASTSRAPPPARRAPVRQGSSAMQAVRGLFKPKGGNGIAGSRSDSPEPVEADETDRDQNGNPSIRFAAMNRPDRDGSSTGTGRPLPVVGSSMSVRRVPSRRIDDQ